MLRFYCRIHLFFLLPASDTFRKLAGRKVPSKPAPDKVVFGVHIGNPLRPSVYASARFRRLFVGILRNKVKAALSDEAVILWLQWLQNLFPVHFHIENGYTGSKMMLPDRAVQIRCLLPQNV